MRRIVIISAVLVAACWWLGCVAVYVTVLAGQNEKTETIFLTLLFGSMAVGFLAGQALRLTGGSKHRPSPLVVAVCVAGLLCMGVQAAANWRIVVGDLSGGVPSGELGDRHLNSHGNRVRELTEEEYQWVEEAWLRQRTVFFVAFSSIVLGMALHGWKTWRSPSTGAKETLPQTASVGGHSSG